MASQACESAVPLRDQVSAAEWRTRVDLAAFYRLVDHNGWVDLIYNHLTARLPDRADHYLINPFGLLFEEITASSLLTLDMDGHVVRAERPGVGYNDAGKYLHGAVLAARADLMCLAHVHTPAIMAVSAMKCGLLPITQTAMGFDGLIGYHDYGFDDVGCERLARDFEGKELVVLRNHGVLIGGRTVAEAFLHLHNFEFACRAQVEAMGAGDQLQAPPADILAAHRDNMQRWFERPGGPRDPDGGLEWQAVLRMLDRRGADYAI